MGEFNIPCFAIGIITFKEETRRQDSQCRAHSKCAETHKWNDAHGHKNNGEECNRWMLSGKLLRRLPFLLRVEQLVGSASHLLALCYEIFRHIKHVVGT